MEVSEALISLARSLWYYKGKGVKGADDERSISIAGGV
jgi:hypothetical protein